MKSETEVVSGWFFMKEPHTKVKTSVLCHFQKDSTSCAGALVQYSLRGMNSTS